MGKKFTLFVVMILAGLPLGAQMWNGTDTLFGNEWIRYEQTYFRIEVVEDGIYRIPYAALEVAGLPAGELTADQYQLWHLGKEVPLYLSTSGILSDGDHLEFYGQQNRAELDQYLFDDPGDLLNPEYSLYTDTAAYYLTWVAPGESTLRYENVPNDLTGLPAPEAWCWATEQRIFNTHHQKAYTRSGSTSVYYSHFDHDGFASNLQQNHNFSLSPAAVYGAGSNARLELRFLSNYSTDGHNLSIALNGGAVFSQAFSGVRYFREFFNLLPEGITGGLNIALSGQASGNDRYTVGMAKLDYPRTFDWAGAGFLPFRLNEAPGDRYLEISGATGGTPLIYDLTHRQRLTGEVDGNLVRVKLPAAAGIRELLYAGEETIQQINTLTPVTFTDRSDLDADFLILTSAALLNGDDNAVQAYADYRASADGGGYSTAIVAVEPLYEQFAYGVRRHPLAVRNFVNFLQEAGRAPDYFFIIGKGREYPSLRNAGQLAEAQGVTHFVPTFGWPGSDNLMLAGPGSKAPVAPAGRLAATTPEEVMLYLDKVQTLADQSAAPQTIEDRAWMKQIIHLGGGAQPWEQTLIRNNLEGMGAILENNLFGASVNGFYKTSTDPLQQSLTEQIFDRINSGTSIITFYGHSSPGTFDFTIDDPASYENYGKYPMMLSLGCYSGDLFTSNKSTGESFIFFRDKGVIAFGASRGLGFISSLNNFARRYYEYVGGSFFGRGIGEALHQALTDYQNNQDLGTATLVEQFALQGDPAIRLFQAPGPDFAVDGNTVGFVPQVIDAQLDSFLLRFEVVNIGQNLADSIYIQVTQELPDGLQQVVAGELIPAPAFRKEVSFWIPSKGKASVGLNQFTIELDATGRVTELPAPAAESNNEWTTSIYITDNSATAVYPAAFSIVSGPEVILQATTTNLLLPERRYIIELDTTESFDSPLAQRQEILQAGGIIKWQPGFNWHDNTVYYWRVSPDSISPVEGFNWDYSSFLFLNGSPGGWNQSHFYQFKKNRLENLKLPAHGQFDFIEDFKDFKLVNAVNSVEPVDIRINSVYYGRYWGFPDGGVYVMWMDSVRAEPRVNFPPGEGPYQYSIPHPSGWWIRTFNFSTATADDRQKVMEFLEEVVPDNDYVLFFTVQRNLNSTYYPEAWAADSLTQGRNLFQVLESQGAQRIRETVNPGSRPYVFAYQKGRGAITEQLAETKEDVLTVYFSIAGNWYQGEMESTVIGPANQWSSLEWALSPADQPETDTVMLEVWGTSADGLRDSLILENLSPGAVDLSAVPAASVPFLKLKLLVEDSLLRTSPGLEHWRVFYQGTPDFALNPAAYFTFEQDTVAQGQPLRIGVAVENLTEYAGDSLLVRFAVRDNASVVRSIQQRYPALPGKDSMHLHFRLNTTDLSGRYFLDMELNPGNDQREVSTANNFLSRDFFVERDVRNPILQVTFDGIPVMDGDLVSARPVIRISLVDENQFLPLMDTSSFQIFLTYPNETVPRLISFDDPEVQFFPATGNSASNRAYVELRKELTEDGSYSLTVQAQDASGNLSGQHSYKLSFKVITESRVSNFLNYPNPFSTSTRFVYTLTGGEPLNRFKIQIMTVSGRLVRELTQDEIGPLQVGTHQTEYTWDGTDEYGDRLANGVYLYRVVAQDAEGREMKRLESEGVDRFFKNGLGKMVILR